jgi:alanine racemase
MAVVKSNAYGHGLIDFSQAAEKLGVDWLGVDSIVEAESLRRSGLKKPILVLGYTLRDKIEDETILIGKNGKSEISADDLADLSGTINYEIITRLNPLIKRIYQ